MAASEQKAYDAIRHSILTGTYECGMHLRAANLAEAIGVSRTPVREALRRLHAEGLVEFFENRGAFVAGWSRDEAEEVFDLRLVLECHAANRAALRLNPGQIERLVELTDRMERHSIGRERDIAIVTDANNRFHGLIIEAAANRRLSAIISNVVELSLSSRTFNIYSDVAFSRSIAHHRELIEAFRERDPVWAAGVMNNHIRAAYHVFTASLRPMG
ncbi:MAG: GntR family transcriptional regulator [Rhizobiaceae bacterium]